MTFGAEIWGPPLIAAAGSGLSSWLGNKSNAGPSKMEKTKQKLIDQLLGSINGGGQYGDLFNVNEDTFQKSYLEPAMSRFQNQFAPQIQQSYIASGQQGNTGLQSALTQAGVDMNQLLNQQYGSMQEAAQNRKQNILSNILGQGSGPPTQQSGLQSIMGGLGGFLQGKSFSDLTKDIFKNPQQINTSTNPFASSSRPGFTPEWSDWKLGDQRWGS